jgi:hypothetical protein
MRQPTEVALQNLSRISLGWSLSTSHSAGTHQAASRLHLMVSDLLDSSYIDERDLVAANLLYKTLCKKMGGDTCQCKKFPLLDCQNINQI